MFYIIVYELSGYKAGIIGSAPDGLGAGTGREGFHAQFLVHVHNFLCMNRVGVQSYKYDSFNKFLTKSG